MDVGQLRRLMTQCGMEGYVITDAALKLAAAIEAAERERCALPQDLSAYMRSHLRRERSALDGFLALGNEAERANRLDGWISVLSGPNVRANRPSGAAQE